MITVESELNAAGYIRFSSVKGTKYLYIRDIAAYYGMKMDKGTKSCSISASGNKISFTYDRRDGSINNIKVNYLFPPFLSGSEPLVSEYDFNFVIEPVLRATVLRKHKIGVIVLDPGHGGNDNGAIGRMYKEKNLTLQIARRVKDALRAKGYLVVMTRDTDKALELDQRDAKANANKADLFVSIHCNSLGNGISVINGIESFCLTPENAPSTSDAKPKGTKFTGNAFNKNNYSLAYSIQKRLLRNTGASDRGVKHARFAVLRSIACPAVLVEAGFMSNYNEERNLGSGVYQDKIAFGIVEGIITYHKAMSGK